MAKHNCDRCKSVPGTKTRGSTKDIVEVEYQYLCKGCRLILTGRYCCDCGQPTYGEGAYSNSLGESWCRGCSGSYDDGDTPGFRYEYKSPKKMRLIEQARSRRIKSMARGE
jgi:hypothetical protein